MATTVIAVAAVVGAGVSIYSAMNQPGAPSIPAPPKPAGAVELDDDGNVLTQQRWDPSKNAYVTEYDPEPKLSQDYPSYAAFEEARAKWQKRKDARAKDNEIRANLKTKALGKLNEGDPEREKQIEEYGKNFAASMHRDVDERFNEVQQQTEEEMTSRGLFGSKAYADTKAQLYAEKGKVDTDIAQKASMTKENLRESDRNYWMNLLSSIDAKEKGDTLLNLEKNKTLANTAGMGTASLMGAWNAQNANEMQKWEAKLRKNQEMTKSFGSTASGLAYLYGYNKGGATGGGTGMGTGRSGLAWAGSAG